VAAFEVIGGGVRVPKVQQVLRERLAQAKKSKLDLSMHLNGDEAMAQGASFYAANISTRFKVRPIGVNDVLPFGVGARIEEAAPATAEGGNGKGLLGKLGLGGSGSGKKGEDGEGEGGSSKWQKRATIFGPGHKLKANRTISFNTSHDLALNLTYEASPLFPAGAQSTIALYDIRGVEALAKEHGAKSSYPPKVFLTFELDASGMVHLVRVRRLT
jgi:hypoxia up-regulated 1